MRDIGDLPRRQPQAGLAGDVADADDASPLVDQRRQRIEQAVRVIRYVDITQLDAKAGRDVIPGDAVAGMFVGAQDDVVAGPPVDAVGDDVDADGRVLVEHDLVGARIQVRRHALPRSLELAVHFARDSRYGRPLVLKMHPAHDLFDDRLQLGRESAGLIVCTVLDRRREPADVSYFHSCDCLSQVRMDCQFAGASPHCHSERSEESPSAALEILHSVQNDRDGRPLLCLHNVWGPQQMPAIRSAGAASGRHSRNANRRARRRMNRIWMICPSSGVKSGCFCQATGW